MYLARSSPTVLTWFMDASSSDLQHHHSGTLMPSGASTPSGPARAGLGHKNSPAKTLQRGYQSPGCGGRCRDLVNVLLPHEFHKISAKGWVRQSFYHLER